jgi:uncharacterized protein YndB with AHSA1/START domain
VPPDFSASPLENVNTYVLHKTRAASPEKIFDAWTKRFDTWFASPGEISMNAIPGEPYWFNVHHEAENYAHYGRFLNVEAGRFIEQTRVTRRNGTDGAETVVRVELVPKASGTDLRLMHSGFYDKASMRRHGSSRRQILEHLDEVLMTATS